MLLSYAGLVVVSIYATTVFSRPFATPVAYQNKHAANRPWVRHIEADHTLDEANGHGAVITPPARLHLGDPRALPARGQTLNCTSFDASMDPDFWLQDCERNWKLYGTPSVIINSCNLGMCENGHAGRTTSSSSEPIPTIMTLDTSPTTSLSCSQLAKDPAADPDAYAEACAHHFGTQVPPYTDTPVPSLSSVVVTMTTTSTTYPPETSTRHPQTAGNVWTTTSFASSQTMMHSRSSTSASQSSTSSTTDAAATTTPQRKGSNQHKDETHPKDTSHKHAVMAGAIVGGLIALALIVGVLWYTREDWIQQLDKLRTETILPEDREEEKHLYTARGFNHSDGDHSAANSPSTANSARDPDSIDAQREGAVQPAVIAPLKSPPISVRNIAMGMDGSVRSPDYMHYAVVNPDPPSVASEDDSERRKASLPFIRLQAPTPGPEHGFQPSSAEPQTTAATEFPVPQTPLLDDDTTYPEPAIARPFRQRPSPAHYEAAPRAAPEGPYQQYPTPGASRPPKLPSPVAFWVNSNKGGPSDTGPYTSTAPPAYIPARHSFVEPSGYDSSDYDPRDDLPSHHGSSLVDDTLIPAPLRIGNRDSVRPQSSSQPDRSSRGRVSPVNWQRGVGFDPAADGDCP